MRRLPVALVVAVVGLTLINVVQDVGNRHGIEADLTSRSAQALSAAGIDADVSFRGRDGTVTVQSAPDADRARTIVKDQAGVRVARVISPPTSATTTPQPPQVRVTVDGGTVLAAGSVPTEAVKTALGGGDQLVVDANRTGAGLDGLPAVVAALGKDATGVVVDLSGGRLTLTGMVSSPAAADATRTAAQQVTADVVDQLQVQQSPAQTQTRLNSLPRVTFANKSATLTAEGRKVVAEVAGILKANPDAEVSIEGHTDSVGSAASNLKLSRDRARTVRSTLIAAGIAAGRLTSSGFGSTRPKVPDTSAANRAINRRVEFIVH